MLNIAKAMLREVAYHVSFSIVLANWIVNLSSQDLGIGLMIIITGRNFFF